MDGERMDVDGPSTGYSEDAKSRFYDQEYAVRPNENGSISRADEDAVNSGHDISFNVKNPQNDKTTTVSHRNAGSTQESSSKWDEFAESYFNSFTRRLHRTRKRTLRKYKARQRQFRHQVLRNMEEDLENENKLMESQYRRHIELKAYLPSRSNDSTADIRDFEHMEQIQEDQYLTRKKEIWGDIIFRNIPKLQKLARSSNFAKYVSLQKVSYAASRVAARNIKSLSLDTEEKKKRRKLVKEIQIKAKKISKEVVLFWRKNEKEEKENRKRAEKEAIEKLKKEEEAREKKRQMKKLNFLITQTELYSHFVVNKLKTEEEEEENDENKPEILASGETTDIADMDDAELNQLAKKQAQAALSRQQEKTKSFDKETATSKSSAGKIFDTKQKELEMDLVNPSLMPNQQIPQPEMLNCELKPYQLKGLNWLANLYEQGINGILADDMGLGKTVQSISLLSWLAETNNIWGPFLVVSPASTLHNWQQEITKFAPNLRALPYWGSLKDRKILRKFWTGKKIYDKESPFHVIVTSYQIVVQDQQYFQRVKWQYMILDEAHAIKSSGTTRWKTLINFNCRNRLLLTGTPIQNNMQELWALLHFIMPTLFDSHEEFAEWFSKDIESHAADQSTSALNQRQLSRLHMILKPFMLRRIKRDVEHELGEKIEKTVYCDLTPKQRKMYDKLSTNISIDLLLEKSLMNDGSSKDDETLMNLVMHFRKVCNHPQLFEIADTKSPFVFGNTNFSSRWVDFLSSSVTEPIIRLHLPKLVYDEIVEATPQNSNLDIWNTLNITKNMSDSISMCGFSGSEARSMLKLPLMKRCLIYRSLFQKLDDFAEVYGDQYPYRRFYVVEKLKRDYKIGNQLSNIWKDVERELLKIPIFYSPSCTSLTPEMVCSSSRFETRNSVDDPLWDAVISHSRNSKCCDDVQCKDSILDELLQLDYLSWKPGLSHIKVPNAKQMLFESGKLLALDKLLKELKENGHRVLIYFQMTKMIDLMEDYLTFRHYSYLRLDGSSKISERRDMVSDWQSRSDIFIFLLSTRAGGIGINLTAADTVIFYDSDWNPTIDQQAMDRAHRLGQTRQVTVYRLISRNTVEERILQRAMQKDEIQKVVISGGAFNQEVNDAT